MLADSLQCFNTFSRLFLPPNITIAIELSLPQLPNFVFFFQKRGLKKYNFRI